MTTLDDPTRGKREGGHTMTTMVATILGFVLIGTVHAAETTVTPEMQSTLDAQKKVIAAWAADPVLAAAVRAQNEKGPIPGMDNAVWKATPRSDPLVQAFQKTPAGVWLTGKLKASDGLFTEAFLSAAKGEKVAFVEKTTSYIHSGSAKFNVPMSGKEWQGQPEFDESTQVYAVQISTPVPDNGKTIGVLVVGVSMKKLGVK
jgi:hypothetical protein